jgi:hypothetical protein
MPRPLVIDLSRNLPSRPRALSPSELPNIFGGCVVQGQACASPADCCQVPLAPGDYVLCYFYRGHGDFVSGYCTRSSVVHGS